LRNAVHSRCHGCAKVRTRQRSLNQSVRTVPINVESRCPLMSSPFLARCGPVYPPSQPPPGTHYSWLLSARIGEHGAITRSSVASGALHGGPVPSRIKLRAPAKRIEHHRCSCVRSPVSTTSRARHRCLECSTGSAQGDNRSRSLDKASILTRQR